VTFLHALDAALLLLIAIGAGIVGSFVVMLLAIPAYLLAASIWLVLLFALPAIARQVPKRWGGAK